MEKVTITQAQFDEIIDRKLLLILDAVYIQTSKFRKVAQTLMDCGWTHDEAWVDALCCFVRVEG